MTDETRITHASNSKESVHQEPFRYRRSLLARNAVGIDWVIFVLPGWRLTPARRRESLGNGDFWNIAYFWSRCLRLSNPFPSVIVLDLIFVMSSDSFGDDWAYI
jgi:hypothetical protein